MLQIGEPQPAQGIEQLPVSALTLACRAAMPGLEYMHDHGQIVGGTLPPDHVYFPGQNYEVKNFYFSPSDVNKHGQGAWSVEVTDQGRNRLMIGAVSCEAYKEGAQAKLVRPAKGARLVAVDNPELEAQVASVLDVFAVGYDRFVAQGLPRQRQPRPGLARTLFSLLSNRDAA